MMGEGGLVDVLVADDEPPALAELVAFLRRDARIGEVHAAANGAEALRIIELHRVAGAFLDIHMPGNGITAAREIARTLPGTAVVMLTASAEDADLFDSLRAGASGYLLKDTDPAVLVDELRSALEGEAPLSRRLVSRIMEEFRSPATPRFTRRSRASARLSAREWEVMELLGDPQRTFPVIHVTGTNGKTSTARIIEALLREIGLNTGRFTSPHLHSMLERIAVGGRPVDAERFASLDADSFLPEEFRLGDRALYLCLPDGLGRSPLAVALAKPALTKGTVATSRNWNTVTKLVEMTRS